MYKSFSSKSRFWATSFSKKRDFFMGIIQKMLQKWGKVSLISVFLVVAFVSGTFTGFPTTHSQTKVLGASIHVSPTPTLTPVPTTAPITIINNIILPTAVPTTITPTPVGPTPTPIIIVVTPTPTPLVTPTAMPTQTPTVTATPTPTPIPQTVTVAIDYAGEHTVST